MKRARESDKSDFFRVPRPAVAVAVAMAAGCLFDRICGPLIATEMPSVLEMRGTILGLELVAACLCIVMTCLWLALDRKHMAVVTVLLATFFVAAGRHHLSWSLGRPDDISQYASQTARPMRLIAQLTQSPKVMQASSATLGGWQEFDRTMCQLECLQLQNDGEWRPVSGRLLATVTGHMEHARLGDIVEVRGLLARPTGPRNPDQFDYPDYLRSKGVRCVAYCKFPEAVQRIRSSDDWKLSRWMASCRYECQRILRATVAENRRATAASLLLGDRAALPDQVREEFAKTGMMHVLAISGLHVGIMAGLAAVLLRMLQFSPRSIGLIVLVLAVGYALLTDGRPPVIRAVAMLAVVVLAGELRRPFNLPNSLAAAAVGLMLWRPTDVFDTGAQLSFVAVAAIGWGAGNVPAFLKNWRRDADDTGEHARLKSGLGLLGEAYWISAIVWLVTTPLVVEQFHLLAPIGFVLNVLLIPLVSATLWAGALTLWLGLLWLPIAVPVGWLFDALLGGLLTVVSWSSEWDLGHRFTAGLGPTWTIGLYAFLLLTAVGWRTRWKTAGIGAACLWLIAGLVSPLIAAPPGELTCTFCSVGHGLAVVLQMPNGRVAVYDCGSLSGGEQAAAGVRSTVWNVGQSSIDALVISHADMDHFNGVSNLLMTIPVASVVTPHQMLASRQYGLEDLWEMARRQNVSIQAVSTGDRLSLDPDVRLAVLQPEVGFKPSSDNAGSLVLLIEYSGQRLLLCGDLEDDGLAELLSHNPGHVDILLSPHHGSLRSNPPELQRELQPDVVIASGGWRVTRETLQGQFSPQTRILSTYQDGAITVRIAPDGQRSIETFLPVR